MAGKRTTIMDIAREVGMDYSTVSLALRRDPRIRSETRLKIEVAAAQLGYMPNQLARSLSGGGTRTIGVLLTDMHRFFVDPLEEMQTMAEDVNYALSVHFCFFNHEREIQALRRFCESRVEGIIWAPAVAGDELARTSDILRPARIPTVMLSIDPHEHLCHQVGVPIQESFQMAVDYLIKHGHRKIAIATAASKLNIRGDMHGRRLDRLRTIFAQSGISLPDDLIYNTTDNEHGAIDIVAHLLKIPREKWPSVIFAADDMLARGLLKGFRALNIDVPGDISLLGYDVVFNGATDSAMPLTTISLETRKMAREAMSTLMENIKSPVAEERRVIHMTPHIVESAITTVATLSV